MRTRLLYLFCSLLLLPMAAGAQDKGTIRGTVTDGQTGETVPGVNVTVVDLQMGAATSGEGTYEITGVPSGTHTLRATFVGYDAREREVTVRPGETTTVNIKLTPSEVSLDEVVVTALGIEQEERSLGYAATQVEGQRVAEAAEPNLTDALAGKIPGLQIASSSGQPGKSSRITIRGNSSYVEGGNSPLIVVDGMIMSNAEDDYNQTVESDVLEGGTANRLTDLDPNAIESVNVLKGASATALYGSRASNGAIIIETKSGRGVDGFSASYTTSFGYNQAIVDGYQDEYLQGRNGGYLNGLPASRGGYNERADSDSPNFDSDADPEDTQTSLSYGPHKDEVSQAVIDSIGQPQTYNPRDAFYENGSRLQNSVTLSGSGDFGNASVTITDSRNDGIVPTTQYNKTSVSAKYGVDFSEDFRVQVSSQYTQSDQDYMLEGNGNNSYKWGLMFSPISYDISDTEFDDGSQRRFSNGTDNPLWFTDRQNVGSNVKRYIGNFQATYDLTDWLTLQEDIGVDTYTDNRGQQINANTLDEPSGFTLDQAINRTEVNSTFDVRMDQQINEDLGLDVVVGNNISWRNYEYDRLEGTGIGVADFFNISNFTSTTQESFKQKQTLLAAFGKATLNYRDYAYLTVTGRNDWSSTLPEGNRSYFYPSVSTTFIFTELFSDTFEETPLSFGKVRASLAQVGSDTEPYSLRTTFAQANPSDGQRGNIDFPFREVNGATQENVLANADLQPEITTEYELGANLRFFGNRANLDVTYYNRSTEDQIFDVPVSAATGFTNQSRNAGEIVNRGWEIQLGGTPLEAGDFSLDLGVNWSTNTTEVVSLAPGVENIYLFGFITPQIRAEEGENGYGVIYGSRYLRNGMISEDNPVTVNGTERTSPLPGFGEDALLIGSDGLPERAPTPGNIGNVQPDWEAGISSTFRWKGFSLFQQWNMSQGAEVMNLDRYYMQLVGTHVSTENRGTEVTRDGIQVSTGQANEASYVRDQGYFSGPQSQIDERFVEDASYVKLQQLSLAYDFSLPENVQTVGLESLQVQLTGRNLLVFTDFSMGDPSGSLAGAGNGQGFYHGVTPSTRTYQASLTFNF